MTDPAILLQMYSAPGLHVTDENTRWIPVKEAALIAENLINRALNDYRANQPTAKDNRMPAETVITITFDSTNGDLVPVTNAITAAAPPMLSVLEAINATPGVEGQAHITITSYFGTLPPQ